MKKLILLFLLFVAGCAGVEKLPQKQMLSITSVIEVPGMAKERIFNKTGEWVAKYLQFANADVTSGIILARGEVCYPSRDKNRAQHTIVFTMKNIIRDNRNEVTFMDIMLKSPGQYISEAFTVQEYKDYENIPVVSERDIEATRNALRYIVDNLADYLKGTARPLTEFPACGAIITSPEGTTDYLKHHPELKAMPVE